MKKLLPLIMFSPLFCIAQDTTQDTSFSLRLKCTTYYDTIPVSLIAVKGEDVKYIVGFEVRSGAKCDFMIFMPKHICYLDKKKKPLKYKVLINL